MISQEFKATVAEKNLLKTRIMIKDSFLLNPTFEQLNEMLSYAEKNLPNLYVPDDKECLEDDSSKWTTETMNEELVHLVNNFCVERINHLKSVVSKMLKEKAESINNKREIKKEESRAAKSSSSFSHNYKPGSFSVSSDYKEKTRKEALSKISGEASKINKIILKVDNNRYRWNFDEINDLESAAQRILKAIHEYKTNL